MSPYRARSPKASLIAAASADYLKSARTVTASRTMLDPGRLDAVAGQSYCGMDLILAGQPNAKVLTIRGDADDEFQLHTHLLAGTVKVEDCIAPRFVGFAWRVNK
jgi:hypothetical protein